MQLTNFLKKYKRYYEWDLPKQFVCHMYFVWGFNKRKRNTYKKLFSISVIFNVLLVLFLLTKYYLMNISKLSKFWLLIVKGIAKMSVFIKINYSQKVAWNCIFFESTNKM